MQRKDAIEAFLVFWLILIFAVMLSDGPAMSRVVSSLCIFVCIFAAFIIIKHILKDDANVISILIASFVGGLPGMFLASYVTKMLF